MVPTVDVVAVCDIYCQQIDKAPPDSHSRENFYGVTVTAGIKEWTLVLSAHARTTGIRVSDRCAEVGKTSTLNAAHAEDRDARPSESRARKRHRICRWVCSTLRQTLSAGEPNTDTASGRSRWRGRGGREHLSYCGARGIAAVRSLRIWDLGCDTWDRCSGATTIRNNYYNFRAYLDFGVGR